MSHKVLWMALALAGLIYIVGCGGGSGKTIESIAATIGTPQSTAISTPFAAPLVATVTTGGNPVSGAVVTFTAPAATGASGKFANGTNTTMVATGANGQASAAFTANGTAGSYTVMATVAEVAAPANFSLMNTAGPAAEITCTSGSGQSAEINTAFGAPLVVQVADSGGNPVNDSGVVVTYTAPAQTGASATFANGMNTATTNASGVAMSAVVSANGATGGPYVVSASATIAMVVKACNFSLTNTAAPSITVSITPGGALLPANIPQQFTATVNNDPTSKGVMWTLTQGGTACSPACGTISSANSSSGAPITYTAPIKVPASPTATLTASSVTDTTKSASATITVSVGTVELVPNILDFGSLILNHNSSPQSTTLTNTGNSVLSVASIMITGTNATDFSQSSTCTTSVGAGNSCTISVTFKPTKTGLRSADVSIGDNSPGSPQQISLSGTGSTRGAASAAAVQSTLAQEGTAVAPRPGGPDRVGTRTVDLVDPTRNDPYLANGTKRELLVRFWYPASLNQECQPAEYASPKVWTYFSKLVGVALPEVTTNSCLNAPVADGAHPVVAFTPGYTGTFTDYIFIFEDLASRGYVVASVDHTYEATAVEFPDGRFAESVLGSHLGDTWRGDNQTLTFATSVRLDDLEFVVNELERLNVRTDSPFAGKMDMSRVAIAGHSMGGATAFLSTLQEPRFRAGIIIDGFLPNALIKPTQTPILILAAGREKWGSDECRLWNNLVGPRLAVNLTGAEHVTPSDAVWLANGAIKTGEMGPEKTIAALRDYIAAFLDANLRGQPSNPLLTGPSSDYPEAAVTTQNGSLGGCSMNTR